MAVLFLTGMAAWLHAHMQETYRDVMAYNLRAILSIESGALRLWAENEKEMVGSWVRNSDFQESLLSFLDRRRSDTFRNRTSSEADLEGELFGKIQEYVHTVGGEGFIMTDPQGQVLLSDQPERIGTRLPSAGIAVIRRIYRNEFLLVPPVRPEELFGKRSSVPEDPVILLGAPAADEAGRIVAALFFSFRPEDEFSRILSLGRFGESGNLCAYDKSGRILSESRRSKGKEGLPALHSGIPAFEPRTSSVQSEGMNLSGYRNYLGNEVVGGWQWLDDLGFGIAFEVEKSAAYRVLSPVRISVYLLFLLTAVSIVYLFFSFMTIRRLQDRVAEIQKVGAYHLERKIGEGGMGKVYKARHDMLKRPAAVKFLNPEVLSEEAVERFEREVRLTAQLTHPNTVEIYDYGRTPDNIFYYAMELIEGPTLAELAAGKNRLPPPRVVSILKQICGSLAEAHALGLIHRDIKPLNIMLCNRGGIHDFVKVLDFGLAKDITGKSADLTAAQSVFGTPGYIPPERLKNPRHNDVRVDIYALGALGYYLLTGEEAFAGAGGMDTAVKVLYETPMRPSLRAGCVIPPDLEDLVMQCLEKDPEKRPESVTAILERLVRMGPSDTWTPEAARHWWIAFQEQRTVGGD